MLDVRYGNKRIELAPKKPTIEVGDEMKLVPTLTMLREAVLAGELVVMVSLGRHRQASLFGSFYDAKVFINLNHETAVCKRMHGM